jgi:hypothetical protein
MKVKRGSGRGHGGAEHRVELREQLRRHQIRKLIRKYARRYNHVTRIREERSWEDKRAFVIGLLQGDRATMKRAGLRVA